MGYAVIGDTEYAWDDPPIPEVTVSENPRYVILNFNGDVIREIFERPPVGFR